MRKIIIYIGKKTKNTKTDIMLIAETTYMRAIRQEE
jgi:hypothetical protein